MKNSLFYFLFVFTTVSGVYAQGNNNAVLVSVGENSIPSVRILTDQTEMPIQGVGNALLFLPPENEFPERWTLIQNEISSLDEIQNEQLRLMGTSRGIGGAIADAIPTQTVQLEQLQAYVANRSPTNHQTTTIFSPADGSRLLNPCLTIRRLPVTDESTNTQSFPTVNVHVIKSGQTLFDIKFAEGEDTIFWKDISGLPERFQEGLPAGQYELRIGDASKSTSFTVAHGSLRERIEQRFVRMESLLGKDDPVTIQISVETLTQDTNGPFYCDALDRIATLPKDHSTPYLEGLYAYLTLRLTGREGVTRGDARDEQEQAEEKAANENPSTDAAFIHKLLLNEKWTEASKRLDGLEQKLSELPDSIETRELKALCHLYCGMILAETGMAKWQDGYNEFMWAIQELDAIAATGAKEEQAIAVSQFRAANNFGNYLLRLTQDRLNNHALAIATGDGAALTDALSSWGHALDAYRAALDIAEKHLTDQPELAATSKVNSARLYALLGDIIRTVDQGSAAVEIEKGAFAIAEKMAQDVIMMDLPNEERLTGSAHHLLADIAFRSGDQAVCRSEAEAARVCYVRTGTISGVEAVERLLGMAETADRPTALKHLSISNALSEVLREQIPSDGVGLSRAGFFARRAYVNERMIELLLEEGKPVEALTVLEAAKGRSLQDIFAGAGIHDNSEEISEMRSIQDILTDWPKEIAALEYFIGSENCWGFLIIDGTVEIFPLLDNDKPISSRELVATVQQYLSDSELQAKKMSMRIRSGEGFGREWESVLYRLRTCLLPDMVLDKLRKSQSKNVLIVPQHILHYLPFAALVVEQDKNDDPKVMPMPKFVLDEPFDVFQAPSLVVWDSLQQRENRPLNSFSVIGISEFSLAKPLSGTKKDVENINNAFGREQVQTIVEDAATKEAMQMILEQRGLLLVGTHGMNSPQSPLQGFLLLRSGDGNDDTITAEEIFETTVGTDLVVLSACYSGLAEQSPLPGDDLFGIQRALLHGGARAVIAGMWDVYDTTGPMIVDGLLKHLADGESVSAALAGAQRDFMKQQRAKGVTNPFTHPYFWSVYTLTGDGRVNCVKK